MEWLTRTPIAHRGLHGEDVPENSTPAFRAAIDAGYAIECDVHVTADGIPIVFHDREIAWGGEHEEVVRELTWPQIRELRIPDTQYAIPRLGIILKLVNGRVPLIIDIKNFGRQTGPIETAVMERLDSYDGEFAVQSFNPLTVGYFKKHRPEWIRGQIAEHFRENTALSPVRKVAMKRLLFSPWNRPHYIAYRHSDLPYWPVSLQRRLNRPILAWTIRDRASLERVRPHCDNVIFEAIRPALDGAPDS